MKKKKIVIITFLAVIGLILAGIKGISSAEELEVSTTKPPAGVEAEIPNYVEGSFALFVLQSQPIIRVYKDYNAWWGENRDHATLLAIGKVPGVDYFIHPMSALLNPIPAGTKVVLITSNSYGYPSTRDTQNNPVAQANLDAFVKGGGILIVDMGDNDYGGGYLAPGSIGTPSLVFPSPCGDVTLDPGAVAANHPFIIGPDGIPGTADDLNNSNIDMISACSVAHGNLIDGITLPADAQVLMTVNFGVVQKAVLAEYSLEGGTVILDTLSKEFVGQNPYGYGPSNIMRNLFSYALSIQKFNKKITSGPDEAQFRPVPDSITFEILNTCGADPQEFFLNGVSLGTVAANPTNSCTCYAAIQTFTVNDPALLAAWNTLDDNTIRYVKFGHGTYFAWVRAQVQTGAMSETLCIFDYNGGNCDELNLCEAGYTSIVDRTTTIGGPDGMIDVVVEVGKSSTTEYDFDITYSNPGGPEVLVVDTVPAEWIVTEVAGNPIVDGSSGGPQSDGNGGTVFVFPASNANRSKSATKIHWRPDPALGSTINVVAETRQSPGKKNIKFAPTSCGALYLNEDGAEAYEIDLETGEPLRDPDTGEKLPPILVSNPLCLAAVCDFNGDGGIVRDGSGDEDGDGLSDFDEACKLGTDPCNPDTDGDSVPDGVDPNPLDPLVF